MDRNPGNDLRSSTRKQLNLPMNHKYQPGKHKNPRVSDDFVKEDEGFFSASSSSDSEPEEATLPNIGYLTNQHSLSHLTEEQIDSPQSVYMEAVNEPQETDQNAENLKLNVNYSNTQQGNSKENTSLEKEAKILKVEATLTEKRVEIAIFRKRHKRANRESSCSGVSDLSVQISCLQEELTSDKQRSRETITRLEDHNSELISKLSDQQDMIIKLTEENRSFLQAADMNCIDETKQLEDLAKTSEAELYKLSDCIDETMKRMELVITNFDEKETCFMERISRVSNEIQISKNWVKLVMEELKPPKNKSPPLSPTRIERLEAKVKKERADKLRLISVMYELQNKVSELEKAIVDKDEGLLRLSEEKIEAIKQLCLWNDYHQCRIERLRDVALVKMESKGSKK